MPKLLIDYLRETSRKFPDKVACADANEEFTFESLNKAAMSLAQYIAERKVCNSPIAVFLPKSTRCVASFAGIMYSGNYYVMLDVKNPPERIKKILNLLNPAYIIADDSTKERLETIVKDAPVIDYDEASACAYDEKLITNIKSSIIDANPAAIFFTSGSTGVPKGAVLTHRGIYEFIEWANDTFQIKLETVIGNQTQFYFFMSMADIFLSWRNGCTLKIIPTLLFSFPWKLAEYIHINQINLLWWVPSALSGVASSGALEGYDLSCLKTIVFGGEVFPTKYLNMWRKAYPNIKMANLYGPTECTDTTHYYIVNRFLKDNEPIPMGFLRPNVDAFLLNENDELAADGGVGELCVRGMTLSPGYYNDWENTKRAFVQNPLNGKYPELIYRTGDLACKNEYGELVYVGRKDTQIKRSGYRIELGEIESAANALDGVDLSCAVYIADAKQVVLFYVGALKEGDIAEKIEIGVPKYMFPDKIKKLPAMPLNTNGKIDRAKLREAAKDDAVVE